MAGRERVIDTASGEVQHLPLADPCTSSTRAPFDFRCTCSRERKVQPVLLDMAHSHRADAQGGAVNHWRNISGPDIYRRLSFKKKVFPEQQP